MLKEPLFFRNARKLISNGFLLGFASVIASTDPVLKKFRRGHKLMFAVLLIGFASVIVATAAAVARNGDLPGFMTGNNPVEKPSPELPSEPVLAEDTKNGPLAEKVVYLTFDDGPNPEVTPRILLTLARYSVPATFFVTGTQVEMYPDVLRQIHAAGHTIGNHSYNHRYNELYTSPAAYISQLEQCNAIVSAILGTIPQVSRAPGGTIGSFTPAVWSSLEKQGFKDVGWNINSGDASSAKAAQISANVIAQTQKNTFLWHNAIVLMHDGKGHEETASALPTIIEFFQKEGFEFRAVDRSTPAAW